MTDQETNEKIQAMQALMKEILDRHNPDSVGAHILFTYMQEDGTIDVQCMGNISNLLLNEVLGQIIEQNKNV